MVRLFLMRTPWVYGTLECNSLSIYSIFVAV